MSAESFTSAMTLSQMRLSSVPERFVLPPPKRPTLNQEPLCSTGVLPIIDLSALKSPLGRSQVIEQVHVACKEFGAFQVINHGIPIPLTTGALNIAAEFFDLPNETKMHLASTDVNKPVRYGTSLNHTIDKVQYWRDFIKHYANPISTWIDLWPSDPPSYKEKMGNYVTSVHVLYKELIETVHESLGLQQDYLQKDIDVGTQVMAVNCYPACPEPTLALGLPPHSDFGLLTIILQDQQGLEIMDNEGKWQSVPVIRDALVVHLGDQMAVLTNGRYKSVVHRAILNFDCQSSQFGKR